MGRLQSHSSYLPRKIFHIDNQIPFHLYTAFFVWSHASSSCNVDFNFFFLFFHSTHGRYIKWFAFIFVERLNVSFNWKIDDEIGLLHDTDDEHVFKQKWMEMIW